MEALVSVQHLLWFRDVVPTLQGSSKQLEGSTSAAPCKFVRVYPNIILYLA